MAGWLVIIWASGTFAVALRKWAKGWPYVCGNRRLMVWAPAESAAVAASPNSTLTVVPCVDTIVVHKYLKYCLGQTKYQYFKVKITSENMMPSWNVFIKSQNAKLLQQIYFEEWLWCFLWNFSFPFILGSTSECTGRTATDLLPRPVSLSVTIHNTIFLPKQCMELKHSLILLCQQGNAPCKSVTLCEILSMSFDCVSVPY